jgi:polysaccharide export outer membrane protein
MKTPRVFAFAIALFAVAAVEQATAQTPFSSTSPPNSNPFGTSGGSQFGPLVRPVQPSSAQYPPVGQPSYAAQAPQPVYAAGAVDPNHRLGRGDRLSYRVQEDRDDKIWPLIVEDDGDVDVPLLGRIKAAGRSTTQLSSEIKSNLEREYYYHATVVLGLDAVAPSASLGRVYMIGALRSQGAVDLPAGGSLTVSQAIAQGGGATDFANLKRVVIIRVGGPPKGIIVNVKAVQNGETDKDVVLKPGDTVKVPEKTLNLSF